MTSYTQAILHECEHGERSAAFPIFAHYEIMVKSIIFLFSDPIFPIGFILAFQVCTVFSV